MTMKKISLLIICAALVVLSGCCTSKKSVEEETQQQTENLPTKETKIETPKDMTKVLFKTSLGDITIGLYDDTPQHKANFLKLVKENYYDGVLFHRIIKGFMIQTGDPDSKTAKPGQPLGSGGPNYTIPAEFVPAHIHKRGALAAARQGDQVNPQKASSGSQFYIVDGTVYSQSDMSQMAAQTRKSWTPEQINIYSTIGGAPFLDGDYTVFGEVLEGMEVVDKIASQQKDRMDRPMSDIKIISTEILGK